jgi:hypothetical protein
MFKIIIKIILLIIFLLIYFKLISHIFRKVSNPYANRKGSAIIYGEILDDSNFYYDFKKKKPNQVGISFINPFTNVREFDEVDTHIYRSQFEKYKKDNSLKLYYYEDDIIDDIIIADGYVYHIADQIGLTIFSTVFLLIFIGLFDLLDFLRFEKIPKKIF